MADPNGKRRILIIDDEPSILKILTRRLELAGYEVFTAADGQEGLGKARAGAPDLILLDLMLPKLSDFDVCATLKEDDRYRGIPVIILTAKGQSQDEQICREAGADAYLNKAATSSVILKQIEALLGRMLPPTAAP